VNLTSGQLARIGQLSDQWSFLWDKRRSLWIAAEDCPDGEQIEESDLDVLLARLPGGRRSPVYSAGSAARGVQQIAAAVATESASATEPADCTREHLRNA